jgi:hypothetical protein
MPGHIVMRHLMEPIIILHTVPHLTRPMDLAEDLVEVEDLAEDLAEDLVEVEEWEEDGDKLAEN